MWQLMNADKLLCHQQYQYASCFCNLLKVFAAVADTTQESVNCVTWFQSIITHGSSQWRHLAAWIWRRGHHHLSTGGIEARFILIWKEQQLVVDNINTFSDVASLGTWSTIAAPVTESSVVAHIGHIWSIKSNSYYIIGKQENAKNISISFIIRVGDWRLSCGTGISVA